MSSRRFLPALLGALVAAGCDAPMSSTGGDPGGKADSPAAAGFEEGTPEAVGVLRLVNDPGTTFEVLRDEAGVYRDAATNIIDHRDGGSGAGNPFDDLAELDAVPQVGPATIRSLLDFAAARGFVPEGDEHLGSYDDVTFTVDEAIAVLLVANTASEVELDVELALDRRAAEAIILARPLASVLALSQVDFVGRVALEALRAHAVGREREIGIISDLDKTIIPPAPSGQEFPDAPYPGIAELLNILEFADGEGVLGDVEYVTARQPESAAGAPAWLAEQGIPEGPISTGISGFPPVASAEKVRDITAVLDANPGQEFVLFGDSSHADPDAYREIVADFADRVRIAFIHDVADIDPARLEGLVLIDHYAEAAAVLFGERILTEDQARAVMAVVVQSGELSAEEAEALLDAHRPN